MIARLHQQIDLQVNRKVRLKVSRQIAVLLDRDFHAHRLEMLSDCAEQFPVGKFFAEPNSRNLSPPGHGGNQSIGLPFKFINRGRKATNEKRLNTDVGTAFHFLSNPD